MVCRNCMSHSLQNRWPLTYVLKCFSMCLPNIERLTAIGGKLFAEIPFWSCWEDLLDALPHFTKWALPLPYTALKTSLIALITEAISFSFLSSFLSVIIWSQHSPQSPAESHQRRWPFVIKEKNYVCLCVYYIYIHSYFIIIKKSHVMKGKSPCFIYTGFKIVCRIKECDMWRKTETGPLTGRPWVAFCFFVLFPKFSSTCVLTTFGMKDAYESF